ncbi:EamA family transporter [Aureimonas sp. AU40]|uniref:EamA family transporter n=1 Tax=Aureimonas sp. AU40 TaxID=1637747 RepID=UPI000782B0FF|nr:EamA family transporter [Aureimonas sp. AU40]
MSGLAAPLVLGLTVILDVGGQILFKTGLDGSDETDTAQQEKAGGEKTGLVRRVLGSPQIAAGVGLYAVEFVAWLFVLSHMDLSVAFPIATLSYVGVVLASRLFLGEAVPPRRWMSTLLIAAGAALVGVSA